LLRKLISTLVAVLFIINTASFVFADTAYNVTVTTDTQSYAVGQTVAITVAVTKAAQPYIGSPITIKVYSDQNNNIIYTDQNVTNTQGKYISYYKINAQEPLGVNNIVVNAGGILTTKSIRVVARSIDPDPISGWGSIGSPIVQNIPAPKSNSDGSVTIVVQNPTINSTTGIAATSISKNTLSAALDAAKSNGQGNKVITIQIPETASAKGYSLELPAAMIAAKSANAMIEINTKLASISIPNNMLPSNFAGVNAKTEISIAAADKNSLPKSLQESIGNRPVVDLSILIDGKAKEWSNSNANVKVALKYTPAQQELMSPDNIVVWYIDNNGKYQTISNSKYSKDTGVVSYATSHFSKYAVVYVDKSFRDIDNVKSWAEKEINAMAARDIIIEKGPSSFDPSSNITRGEFIYGLVRALGFTDTADSNFKDVTTADYYYSELAIAKKLGIAQGTGDDLYKPTESITRQDMATLIERALKLAKKQVKTEGNIAQYADSDKISSYAVSSMKSMIAEGILKGDGKNIKPQNNTSRAEAAVILYRIFGK
jgi:hypothetical protein